MYEYSTEGHIAYILFRYFIDYTCWQVVVNI